MRKVVSAVLMVLGLAACSMDPRPLVPDTAEGPASYVCYNTLLSEPPEVRSIAVRQCSRWGMEVKSVIGQSWTPLRCGFLTPEVVAFRCGRGGMW